MSAPTVLRIGGVMTCAVRGCTDEAMLAREGSMCPQCHVQVQNTNTYFAAALKGND